MAGEASPEKLTKLSLPDNLALLIFNFMFRNREKPGFPPLGLRNRLRKTFGLPVVTKYRMKSSGASSKDKIEWKEQAVALRQKDSSGSKVKQAPLSSAEDPSLPDWNTVKNDTRNQVRKNLIEIHPVPDGPFYSNEEGPAFPATLRFRQYGREIDIQIPGW